MGDRVPRRCQKRVSYVLAAPGGAILGTTSADAVILHGVL